MFSGGTFVYEYPRKFNFLRLSKLPVKEQSIAMGGVFSCPKQAHPSASNVTSANVLVFAGEFN
jgi:hypothetical protein